LVLDELDRMHRLVDELVLLAKARRPDFITAAPIQVADLVQDLLDKSTAVHLWVRDTGPGIASTDQERIFERFGRADDGRGVEGSGLGLAIVSAIASAHGGRVVVASALGEGARFSLELPVTGPGDSPS